MFRCDWFTPLPVHCVGKACQTALSKIANLLYFNKCIIYEYTCER